MNDMDYICLKGLMISGVAALLLVGVDLLNAALDRAAERAHRPIEVDPTRPVVLWRETPICGQDDWGCELQLAYNEGWRP